MQNAKKTKANAVSKADVRVLKAYINQAYLLNKYQTLKADTKEVVKGIFDRLKQNVYIIDNSSYIQKIERTQRRFDSKLFIEHVKTSGDYKLQLLVNGFYKQIETLEFKPFNDKLETIKKGNKYAK